MLRPQIVGPKTPAICPRCGADNCIHVGDPYAVTPNREWRCSNCGLTSWNLAAHGAVLLKSPPPWGKKGRKGSTRMGSDEENKKTHGQDTSQSKVSNEISDEDEAKITTYLFRFWNLVDSFTSPLGNHYALFQDPKSELRKAVIHLEDKEIVCVMIGSMTILNPKDVERFKKEIKKGFA